MASKLMLIALGMILVAGCDQKDMYYGDEDTDLDRPADEGMEDALDGSANARPRDLGIRGVDTTSSLYPDVPCPLPADVREESREDVESDAIDGVANARRRTFAIRGPGLTCGLFDDFTCPRPKEEREEAIRGIEGDWLEGSKNFLPRRFDITAPEMSCPGD